MNRVKDESNILNPQNDTLSPEDRHLANRYFVGNTPTDELLKYAYKQVRFEDPRLHIEIAGIHFDNPLITAAGWDKVGEAVQGLHTLGFGGVEVGSVQARPQDGNPKPRHFILSHGVVMQRYGFNSPGADTIGQNLLKYKNSTIPIGINIGLNKDVKPQEIPEAYAIVAEKLYDAASYFVINVSSPNTPGLRALQDKKPLIEIIKAVIKAMESKGGRKPLFVKIAPELSFDAIDDVIDAATEYDLTGIIAVNTSSNPEIKGKYGNEWSDQMGGLSGDDDDYRQLALERVRYIYKKAGSELTIIGVGGIKDTTSALEMIKAGATGLQILTALQFQGPELPGRINAGIVQYLEKQGIKNIQELVGVDAGR